MIGINGKPWIDLDALIDVDAFKALHHESIYGLARSTWCQDSYGPGVYDQQKFPNHFFVTERDIYYTKAHPDWEEVSKLTFSNDTEKRRYLKLRYGIYGPDYFVFLRRPLNYHVIAHEPSNSWTEDSSHFPNVVAWIKTLPFKEIGRVVYFVVEHDCHVIEHSDKKYSKDPYVKYVANSEHEAEFIWLSATKEKKFYVLDEVSGEKHHVTSNAAWFNSYDVHGSDPVPTMTYTLRIDGVFTDEFRQRILG